AAAAARAAERLVGADQRPLDAGAAGGEQGHPAAQAVPARRTRAAGAADGLVAGDQALADRERRSGRLGGEEVDPDQEAAPDAVATVGPGAAGAAQGAVVAEGGVCDRPATAEVQDDAPGQGVTALDARDAARAADGLVGGDGTVAQGQGAVQEDLD